MTPDVTHVQTLAGFALFATFADGEKRRFSMRPYLHYPAYQNLRHPEKFNMAHVLNGTVAWSVDIDMSSDTLYLSGEEVTKELTEQVS